jgi:hypothetical protein
MGNTETHNNLKEISRLQTQMENVNEKIDGLKEEQVKIQQEQKQGFEKILGKIDGLGRIYVRKDTYKRDIAELKEWEMQQKKNKTWLWQTILVVIIGIIVSSLTNILINGVIDEVRGEQTVQSSPIE